MKNVKTNIGTRERVLRIVAGSLLAIVGVLLILEVGTFTVRLLAATLVILGLDLAITGAIGFCPLYARLDRDTTTRWHSKT